MKTKITTIFFCTILITPLFAMTAVANSPPSEPTIEGPTSGNPGVSIMYGFCSTDPDSDNISICINWGDGASDICIGPIESGICATASHTWIKKGTYIIKAKASDGQAESNWSTLELKIPRSKTSNTILLLNILERFSNMFLILRSILA